MLFHIVFEDMVCQMSVGSHRKQMLSMDGGVMEVLGFCFLCVVFFGFCLFFFFRIISVIDKREEETGVGKESLRPQC